MNRFNYKTVSPEAITAMEGIDIIIDPIKEYFKNNISSMTKEEIDLFSYNLEMELSVTLAEERIVESCRRIREKINI